MKPPKSSWPLQVGMPQTQPMSSINLKTSRSISFVIAIIVALLLAIVYGTPVLQAQTVAPISGLGNVQFFDNSGVPLTNGVLYSYQAGTSTQQATYTDSSGTAQNPNPIPFTTGGRVQIWLLVGQFYKFVLCAQNDGAACAAGDTLFTVDQVPGGSTGGSSSGSPFTGVFISSTASPSSSGALRLATADTICWRNSAGSANLCLRKDSNDLLSWDGGTLKLPEISPPSGVAAFDLLWADSSAHRWMMKNNGGAAAQVVASGQDINTSDFVTQLHFGATPTPLSGTAPTTNQFLQWNGSQIIGATPVPVATVDLTAQTSNCGTQTFTTPAINGFYRFTTYVVLTTRAATSSTVPAVNINWLDGDTSVAQASGTSGGNTTNAVGTTTISFQGFFAKSGTAITLSCVGYASVPANIMQYAIHSRLEGPF